MRKEKLDYVLDSKIDVYRDYTEDIYIATDLELQGCMSSGDTIELAVANLKEARIAWIEAAIEDGYPIPIQE